MKSSNPFRRNKVHRNMVSLGYIKNSITELTRSDRMTQFFPPIKYYKLFGHFTCSISRIKVGLHLFVSYLCILYSVAKSVNADWLALTVEGLFCKWINPQRRDTTKGRGAGRYSAGLIWAA